MMSLSRKRTGLDSLNLELNPFPEFLAEPVMQFLRDPRSTERSGGVKLLMSGLFVSLSRPDNVRRRRK